MRIAGRSTVCGACRCRQDLDAARQRLAQKVRSFVHTHARSRRSGLGVPPGRCMRITAFHAHAHHGTCMSIRMRLSHWEDEACRGCRGFDGVMCSRTLLYARGLRATSVLISPVPQSVPSTCLEGTAHPARNGAELWQRRRRCAVGTIPLVAASLLRTRGAQAVRFAVAHAAGHCSIAR